MVDINDLKYDANGLIPAVVADANTNETLMVAYMNAESLKISMDEGRTCFWSRSRGELWRKGETSGNVQRIISIKTDCDRDTLLITVERDGPVCHTGVDSCFYEDVFGSGRNSFSLKELYDIICDRKANKKEGSYTNYLFDKGVDKILKKIGEESAEVIIAGKSGVKTDAIYEIADLAYHAMVLMAQMGITPGEIISELASRHTGEKRE